jgi:hypothetical protein
MTRKKDNLIQKQRKQLLPFAMVVMASIVSGNHNETTTKRTNSYHVYNYLRNVVAITKLYTTKKAVHIAYSLISMVISLCFFTQHQQFEAIDTIFRTI